MKKIVSVIIPAFNEEQTIKPVVFAALECSIVREVIVVSDGSTDATAALARQAGATLVIEHEENLGKGAAVISGARKSKGSVLVFLDGDLIGLRAHHISALADPLLRKSARMNVGLRSKKRIQIIQKRIPFVSGQRAVFADDFSRIPTNDIQGYALEVGMNSFYKREQLPISHVVLRKLDVRTKIAKVGVSEGVRQYFRMWSEVAFGLFTLRRRYSTKASNPLKSLAR